MVWNRQTPTGKSSNPDHRLIIAKGHHIRVKGLIHIVDQPGVVLRLPVSFFFVI